MPLEKEVTLFPAEASYPIKMRSRDLEKRIEELEGALSRIKIGLMNSDYSAEDAIYEAREALDA